MDLPVLHLSGLHVRGGNHQRLRCRGKLQTTQQQWWSAFLDNSGTNNYRTVLCWAGDKLEDWQSGSCCQIFTKCVSSLIKNMWIRKIINMNSQILITANNVIVFMWIHKSGNTKCVNSQSYKWWIRKRTQNTWTHKVTECELVKEDMWILNF